MSDRFATSGIITVTEDGDVHSGEGPRRWSLDDIFWDLLDKVVPPEHMNDAVHVRLRVEYVAPVYGEVK